MLLNKIFCIGLHKTGTSSLHHLAEQNGFRALHSATWQNNPDQISNYDFFCDGGSHYDNQNEIDFKMLRDNNKGCEFIINIRTVKPWIISKLKHAGWRYDTVIQEDKSSYLHDEWRIKSKRNIELFIDHYFNRYIEILTYFADKPNEAYYVDVCDGNVDHLRTLFKTIDNIPHANKGNDDHALSEEITNFIDNKIAQCCGKARQLDRLICEFKEVKKG